jgi:hypothetical protein
MLVSVTDPIIHIRTAEGTRSVGLHEVLFHAHSGSLIDLSGMRADQRAPVVTAFAIISHLLRRYSRFSLTNPDEWLKALRSLFGDDELVFAGGQIINRNFYSPCCLVWAKLSHSTSPRPTI